MLSFYEITQQGSAPSTKSKRQRGPTVPFFDAQNRILEIQGLVSGVILGVLL